LTEALWLRAVNDARERVNAATLSKTSQHQAFEALENKVTELTPPSLNRAPAAVK
jgi:hypothetical protein